MRNRSAIGVVGWLQAFVLFVLIAYLFYMLLHPGQL